VRNSRSFSIPGYSNPNRLVSSFPCQGPAGSAIIYIRSKLNQNFPHSLITPPLTSNVTTGTSFIGSIDFFPTSRVPVTPEIGADGSREANLAGNRFKGE